MRIAPESRPFWIGSLVLIPPAWWLGGPAAAGVAAVLFLFILFFFRDPRRQVPTGEDLILSPADGRVVDNAVIEDAAFPGGKARRISIFLSIFNVHVNRSPVSGTVTDVTYTQGKFRAAFRGKASLDNERNRIDIVTEAGPVSVIQIAGAIARRIVCDVTPRDAVLAGGRLGLIRFGSRVDLLLPLDAITDVRRGQRVRTTATVLARLAEGRIGAASAPAEVMHAG